MAKRDRNPGNKKRRRNIAAKKSGNPVRRLLRRARVLENHGRFKKSTEVFDVALSVLKEKKDVR